MTKESPAAASKHAPRSTQLDLRKFRQGRGISLEQIAESTKISMRFLRAIEDEDFSQLPGGIFNTSYLRQYAAATGFSEARLLAQYQRECAPEIAPSAEPASSSRGFFLRWWRASA